MTTITFQVPDELLAALRNSPSGLAEEVRLAAAARWYAEGRLSQEVAAQFAGLNRADFLAALSRLGVDSFQVHWNDLARELERG